MRVTSIELHPENSSDVHVLSFRDPARANPYNVVNIDGLDADAVMPRYYGVSGTTGARFYTMEKEPPTIVMRVQLNPQFSSLQSYSDLRDTLYRAISSSRTGLVQIQFKNETLVVAAISAWITKFEAPHFERTPEVKLTFQAQDPMLTALDPVDVDVALLDPELTNVQDSLSTAPHGFTFDLALVADTPELNITDPDDPSWSFVVTPVGGFLTGDVIHFSSDRNNKQLYFIRGGVNNYLADVVAPGSVWPILFPGDNLFALTDPTAFGWMDISYYPTYWGV